MAVESDLDRQVFFAPADFGVAATYTPKAGGARAINVIFDAPAKAIDMLQGLGVSTTDPIATCRTIDLVNGGAHGETLLIGADTYTIRDINPDGTGVTKLELKKQ